MTKGITEDAKRWGKNFLDLAFTGGRRGSRERDSSVGHPSLLPLRPPVKCLREYAVAQRQQPKDVFDIYQTVLHYDGGAHAAAKGFRAEAELNSGFKIAADTVAAHFAVPDGAGPTRCAEFMIGGLQGLMPAADYLSQRDQLREQMVSIAELLRGT